VTFADVEARMGDVPALGQHTRALLVEAGLSEDEADDALSRGIAVQCLSEGMSEPRSLPR
jgi:hypothetical protein